MKCSKNYESFENVFVTVLDAHALRKTKILSGNQKPHVDKNLCKAIIKRSELNLRQIEQNDQKILQITKERRIQYFEDLETLKNSKIFWNKCKPYFSNKHAYGESKIILTEKENVILNSNQVVENEKLIVKNYEIAKIFNKHFSEAVDKLNTSEWLSCEKEDQLTDTINKFKSHPSINKIKSKYTTKQKFSFKSVTVKDIENIIKNIPTSKVTGGEIPLNVLKQSSFTYEMLRGCINDSLLKGTFHDSLKLGNITPVHKKDEPTDKENYRPVKIFERLVYDQHIWSNIWMVSCVVLETLIPLNALYLDFTKMAK